MNSGAGFRRDVRQGGSTAAKCIHNCSSLKDTLHNVPSQNLSTLCQSFTYLLVSTHMYKSCNTRILGPKLQSHQYTQNRLGDLPSKGGGNGRMCQIPEL